MSLIYTFSDAEIQELEAARKVFNRFTGSRYSIQKFIAFTITEAIRSQLECAIEAQGMAEKRPMPQLSLVGGDYVH